MKLTKDNIGSLAEKATKEEIREYINTLPKGKEYDYTNNIYGTVFLNTQDHQKDVVLWVRGDYKDKDLAVGDVLVVTNAYRETNKYLILHIAYLQNSQIFWAYITKNND